MGCPQTRYVDEAGHRPVLIEQLVKELPRAVFQTVRWRQGSRGVQSSRFAAVRVHTAEHHFWREPPSEEVWLLVEWPRGEAAQTKYRLSSLPADIPLKELVRLSKLRWRVERDCQELKGEVGLDHFEGRSWRGFHHHATLCMVAHGFLALHRVLFPQHRTPWTLAEVRRRLQLLLLRRIGHCPLCRHPINARAPPRAASRM